MGIKNAMGEKTLNALAEMDKAVADMFVSLLVESLAPRLSPERIHELMLAQQNALDALRDALPAGSGAGDVYQPLWDATQSAVWAMEAAWKEALGHTLESDEAASLKLRSRCAACGCPEHRQ